MKLGLINSAWAQAQRDTAYGIRMTREIGFDTIDIFADPLDLDVKEEEHFILVGPGEEDYDQNKILITSPIGQGLVGKNVGDEVEVKIPRGTLKLKIVEIGAA